MTKAPNEKWDDMMATLSDFLCGFVISTICRQLHMHGVKCPQGHCTVMLACTGCSCPIEVHETPEMICNVLMNDELRICTECSERREHPEAWN